jgi:HEAT repeat protein
MTQVERERVIAALKDPDPVTREHAADDMGACDDPSLVPWLVEAAGDPVSGVRWRAVRALGKIGVGSLLGMQLIPLLDDPEAQVRAEVVRVLAATQDRQFLDPLRARLGDPDLQVQSRAIEAMGEIGTSDPPLIERLLGFLAAAQSQIRMHAVVSLGKLGNRSAVPGLIRSLNDSNPQVRGLSAWSLGMLGDERSLVPLLDLLEDEGEHVRLHAYQAVSAFGSRAIPALERAVSGVTPHSRFAERLLEELVSEQTERG